MVVSITNIKTTGHSGLVLTQAVNRVWVLNVYSSPRGGVAA